MIADTADIQNDLRGPRFNERAGKMMNHARAPITRRAACRIAALFFLPAALAAGRAEEPWVLLPQPKFLAHKVSIPIAGAKETVLAAARWTTIGPDFATAEDWRAAAMDERKIETSTLNTAATWLKGIEPRFVRDRRKVVQYSVVRSEKAPVAAAVLAPEFLKMHGEVFGPKVLVVMPNLYTVFVFPALAGDLQAHADTVLEAWNRGLPRVSLEVFELTAEGMRAVGTLGG